MSDSSNLSKIASRGTQAYAFDRGDTFGHVRHLHGACGAGRAAPTLESTSPVLGHTPVVSGSQAPASSAGVVIFSAVATKPIVVGPCAIHVDPSSAISLPTRSDGAGKWQLRFPLPRAAGLKGVRLTLQAAFPGKGGALGFELANAVTWTLGD